jgi:hypothetical protein
MKYTKNVILFLSEYGWEENSQKIIQKKGYITHERQKKIIALIE